MSWQQDAGRQLVERARVLDEVAEVWVFGSGRRQGLLDAWSDLDVGLVLTGPLDVVRLLQPTDVVWALDRQQAGGRSTCRVVLADGRRLDLVVASRNA